MKTDFSKQGCIYHQEALKGNIAMYSLKYDQKGPTIGFDVWKVPEVGVMVLDGKSIETGGLIPGSGAWGSSAWSYSTRKLAETKFNELINAE